MASPDFQLKIIDAQLAKRVQAPPNPAYKALDIGCGWGRHLVYLARQGWRVTGLDWSASAVYNSRALLKEHDLHGQVIQGDLRRMPLSDSEYQLIIAVDVLQHGRLVDFRRSMTEIKRILRINSYVIFCVPTSRNAPHSFPGTWVENNTLVMSTGIEAGIPHHFFTADEIRAATPMFHDVSIEAVEHPLPPGIDSLHPGHVNEWFWIKLRG